LAKDASFRLIVSGNIGVKEIERPLQKLEIDKEILADQDDSGIKQGSLNKRGRQLRRPLSCIGREVEPGR
jgi:hypothetical protein